MILLDMATPYYAPHAHHPLVVVAPAPAGALPPVRFRVGPPPVVPPPHPRPTPTPTPNPRNTPATCSSYGGNGCVPLDGSRG